MYHYHPVSHAEAAALRKRSSAIKRGLPRPADVSTFTKLLQEELGDDVVPATKLELADRLVKAEMLTLLEHDAVKYPVGDGRKKKGGQANGAAPAEAPALPDVDEEDLKEVSAGGKGSAVLFGFQTVGLVSVRRRDATSVVRRIVD